jgi:hypothetical protein
MSSVRLLVSLSNSSSSKGFNIASNRFIGGPLEESILSKRNYYYRCNSKIFYSSLISMSANIASVSDKIIPSVFFDFNLLSLLTIFCKSLRVSYFINPILYFCLSSISSRLVRSFTGDLLIFFC